MLRGDVRPQGDADEQGPKEECGVFGVWAPGEEVSKLTYFGMFALQHRGQVEHERDGQQDRDDACGHADGALPAPERRDPLGHALAGQREEQ